MISTQIKSQMAAEGRQVVRRADDLLAAFVAVDQQRTALRAEVSTLRETLEQHQAAAGEMLREQVLMAGVEAGLTPVSGPGVLVTVNSHGTGPILDEDIWKIINEIKGAGVEAISVNNYRLTPRTSIRYDRVQLLIDDKPLIAPIDIRAVGDPRVIEAALTMRGGPVQRLAGWLQIDIAREENLLLPAREAADFQFAAPVKP